MSNDTTPTAAPTASAASAPSAPATSAFTPVAASAPQGAVDERTGVLVAHLSGLASFFGPLVVWLVYRGKSPLVEREAKEALNFQLTVALLTIAVMILGTLLALVVVGLVILAIAPFIPLVGVVFAIIAAVKSGPTGHFRYPATLRLIK
jgi:uncharacterized Tic20 family protein